MSRDAHLLSACADGAVGSAWTKRLLVRFEWPHWWRRSVRPTNLCESPAPLVRKASMELTDP
jgi:hypothetical protein